MEMAKFVQLDNSINENFTAIDGGGNRMLGLRFDYKGEKVEENCNVMIR
jgi:hypothetical protein